MCDRGCEQLVKRLVGCCHVCKADQTRFVWLPFVGNLVYSVMFVQFVMGTIDARRLTCASRLLVLWQFLVRGLL